MWCNRRALANPAKNTAHIVDWRNILYRQCYIRHYNVYFALHIVKKDGNREKDLSLCAIDRNYGFRDGDIPCCICNFIKEK